MLRTMESTLYTKNQFNDADELAEFLQDWDVEFRQLENGQANNGIEILATPSVFCQKVQLEKNVHQIGLSPKDQVTFGFFTSESSNQMKWCSSQSTTDNLMFFSEDQQWEAVSRPSFTGYTLSFDKSAFSKHMETSLQIDYESMLSTEPSIFNESTTLAPLFKERIKSIFLEMKSSDTGISSSNFDYLENELLTEITNSLTTQINSRLNKRKISNHEKVRKKTLEYMHSNISENILMSDICAELGTSMSTLERVFKSAYDTGPKNYYKILKLHHFRRALLKAPEGTTITEIAAKYGFLHMGQLAVDYKKLFGESPQKHLSQNHRFSFK